MILLFVAAVAAIYWPGVPMYDTVSQYDQVVSGEVEDWHPPVMVRLWQLLHSMLPGAIPMFLVQVCLYAIGFALLAAALARTGRRSASAAVVVLAISPLVLGWQMVVLKDAQMLGTIVGALGIVAHYRFRGVRLPVPALVLAILLLAYATLVRANALFATVPLCALLVPRPRPIAARATLAIAAILLLLALEPLINNRLFAAAPSGVAKSQPLFDLGAIAVATPGSVAPFTPREREALIERHCVKPFFWDPLGDPSACGPITSRANALSERELYVDLARAAAAHPLAYADHRIRHWNTTERWLVSPGLIDAAPPRKGEPNEEGLAAPSNPAAQAWQSLAAFEASTPLGWPISWTVLSLLLLPTAWHRRAQPQGQMALGLLVSAAALEASFLVISIASDLRYHLWSLVAVPLAFILLAHGPIRFSRRRIFAALVMLMVIGSGVAARFLLPPGPATYQAMLHA